MFRDSFSDKITIIAKLICFLTLFALALHFIVIRKSSLHTTVMFTMTFVETIYIVQKSLENRRTLFQCYFYRMLKICHHEILHCRFRRCCVFYL